ncbi:MAG: alkaline phosphatase D family protein, partial [Actinomycetota bacterium]
LEVADFEEYTRLYWETWGDPVLRWLLSTVPTAMIFDDHDISDDWNTSAAWVEHMRATEWWDERIVSGLASYWLYQHLGNLSPDDLDDDPVWPKVRDAGDATRVLREFAYRADREVEGTRWSYTRDFGRTRLVVIDSRCGRVLDGPRREMVDDDEWAWIEEQASGDFDHLLLATSLPFALAPAVHDLEAWTEAVTAGAWGRLAARVGERIRQAIDLEHWAAFRASFDRLTRLIADVGRSEGAPASISVLSGDVHHAYVARARFDRPVSTPVYQLTCSPVHNTVPGPMRLAFRAGWWRPLSAIARRWARWSGVPAPPVDWRKISGPYFGNVIATVDLTDRTATTTIERATPTGLTPHPTLPLT